MAGSLKINNFFAASLTYVIVVECDGVGEEALLGLRRARDEHDEPVVILVQNRE